MERLSTPHFAIPWMRGSNEHPESKMGSRCSLLGDLREKSFKIVHWSKGFFAQPAKTGTATWEQLLTMFSPLNEL